MPTTTDPLQAARDLFEKLRSDADLRAKVTGVKSYQELLRVTREAGFDLSGLSAADLRGLAALGRSARGELDDDELASLSGGAAEAQIFQALSSAISEVMKNFGGALQTAARG